MNRFRDWISVSVRMPKSMHAQLHELAREDGKRSLHSLILAIFRQFLDTKCPNCGWQWRNNPPIKETSHD
jgi:hypothetical protein